jgi:peptide/nickel transport system substrate-binding protein
MEQGHASRGRSAFFRMAASLLGAVVLLSCGPAPAGRETTGGSSAPAGPKRLVIGVQVSNEQDYPAPYGGSGAGSAALEHFFIFHANLTAFDSQRVIIPRLAEKVPSIDDGDWRILPTGGMEVTWKIKPTAVWHDGTPLTADDFVFGLKVYKDPEFAVEPRGELANVTEAVAADPHTLVVRWKTQSILGNVNGNDGVPVLPRHLLNDLYATGDRATFENSPYLTTQWVGLGPYRLDQWVQGSYIDASAFDQYVLGRPKIDRITIRYIGDVNALVANVLAGEIDLIPAGAQLDINQMVAIRQAWDANGAGSTLLNTKSVRTIYLQLRDSTLPWQDLRVRQALIYGLNREEIVEALLFGLVPRADFYVPPDDPLAKIADERGLPRYPYDLTRAERLLAEAGWTRGADRVFHNSAGQPLTVDVTASGQGDNVAEATTVAGQWSASGFLSKPTPYPANLATEAAGQVRHSIPGALIWPWNFTTSDPRTITTTEIGSVATRWRGGNYGGYSNPTYDSLYDQLASELDITKRQETQFQMLKILAEELPVLPMFYRATGLAMRKGVEGPTTTPPIQAGSAWNIHQWDVK